MYFLIFLIYYIRILAPYIAMWEDADPIVKLLGLYII